MKYLFSAYHFLLFFTLLSFTLPLQGQTLTVGSTLPPMTFKNIVNAPYRQLDIKALGSTPILLEFWSTRCGYCHQTMFQLAALQQEFKKDLLILSATPEGAENVQRLFEKRPDLKALGLPSLVGDKVLLKHFPARQVPHLIWIGGDRKIKAITDATAATSENIQRFIRGESLAHLPQKIDLVDFDVEAKLLLDNGPLVRNRIRQSSLLTGEVPGAPSRIGSHRQDSNQQIVCINQSPLSMYQFAYRYQLAFHAVHWKNRILKGANAAQENGKRYCYELLLPIVDVQDKYQHLMYKTMQKDLDRLFDITSSVQKRYQPVYVFEEMSRQENSPQHPYVIIPGQDSTRFENVGVKMLLSHIEGSYPFELPVVYVGSLEQQLSIRLPNKLASLEAVEKTLQGIGFALKKENRWIETLVLE